MRARIAALIGVAAAVVLSTVVARAADPDALWKIVHGRCVPDEATGNPAPCAQVTPDWAVLKDLVGATQFLLIPTARVTGIESPAILAPGAPNYFEGAWEAQKFMDDRAGHVLPRNDIALAINPPGARSQEQLHIHVDCVRPDIRDALAKLPISTTWDMLPEPLAGQHYAARLLDSQALEPNPFHLLADGLPGAADAMGKYTLVAIGREGGFILLAGRIEEGGGHGEDLQDHSCAVAKESPP